MTQPAAGTTGDVTTLAPIVSVEELSLDVHGNGGVCQVLSGISFQLRPREIFALVGESGCGKSLTCLSLARLHQEPPFAFSGGRILIHDRNVLDMTAAELRQLRGGVIAYVFQDPGASLNPVLRIGTQIAEAIRLHDRACADVAARVIELLHQVGIPDPAERSRAFPHQLSGGMQQRAMIAMALSCRPAVLVADEPTTALDVTIQAQILELLRRLRNELNTAILLVTHNLGVVAGLADTVAVMYAGQIVEQAPARELLHSPRHPYTRALLAAVPRLGERRENLATIPGRVPTPADYPAGCRFEPRCDMRSAPCAQPPALREIAPGHWVRCAAAK